MKRILAFLYFFICASLLFSVTALAYIDPSAMTYIIQLVAGVAIAAGAAFSFYFRKLKRKLSGVGKKREPAVQHYDKEDDDETGFGDYEIEGAAAPAPAAPRSAEAAQVSASVEPMPMSGTVVPDPYDEAGGEGGLAAENRELRRLLREEQRKVEELKRALHICTAPRR